MMLIKIYNCEKRFMGRGAKTMGRGGEELFLKVFFQYCSQANPRRADPSQSGFMTRIHPITYSYFCF